MPHVQTRSLGSLQIDNFFNGNDVGTAESPTTHVQKGVAQNWVSSHGHWRRQTEFYIDTYILYLVSQVEKHWQLLADVGLRYNFTIFIGVQG